MLITLEEYFKTEFGQGKVEHTVRVHCFEGRTEIYIHPSGRDGLTTPTMLVEGNMVRPKPF